MHALLCTDSCTFEPHPPRPSPRPQASLVPCYTRPELRLGTRVGPGINYVMCLLRVRVRVEVLTRAEFLWRSLDCQYVYTPIKR